MAYRQLTSKEYEVMDRRLFEARTALQQREEKLANVFQFIEKDLILLGATAVEDRQVSDKWAISFFFPKNFFSCL